MIIIDSKQTENLVGIHDRCQVMLMVNARPCSRQIILTQVYGLTYI